MSNDKLIVLGRHGKTTAKGDLVAKDVRSLYGIGSNLREKYFPQGVSPEKCSLWHSYKPITKDSGISVISGLLNLTADRKKPSSVQDLEKINLEGVTILQDFCLDYESVRFNEKVSVADEKYFDWWVSDSSRATFREKPITSFNSMLRTGKMCLHNAISKLFMEDKDVILLESHRFIIESIFMAALNSSRDSPVSAKRMGGLFGSGEHAELLIKEETQYKIGHLCRKEDGYMVSASTLSDKL